MQSFVDAQTMSEESVTCIAVKEGRHQNIMSSVALKKGVEEPWTTDREAKIVDVLGYREMTLQSDTELAIIAFRDRVAEMCKARGRSATGHRIEPAHRERSDADTRNHQNHQRSHRKQHTRTTQ